jgi:uncharacterized cupin superfamily protein
VTEPVNLFDVELGADADDPEGYRASYARVGPLIGAAALGLSVYELPPGQSICPYHLEYGNEEWLLVLEGRPTLRTPEGERELEPGDAVCFPEGPEGAHKVTNRAGEGRALVGMLSTKHDPAVAVYPDSNKIGAWSGNDEHRIMARLGADLDYWDGEV